ncbi:MAG TPA: cbb3-type cytochrome c oxidase subunit I [Chthoniobacterales bacterium]|nr:cbb3-type cytochrome c oxidase subunit I [Chthoniobacterales bacterium]
MNETAIVESESRIESATLRTDFAAIDRSIQVPVLVYIGSGIFWLIIASLLFLLSSSQIHKPTAWWTLPGISWLSYGRVFPGFMDCLVYGWAVPAGIGVGIWLLSRFSTAPLRHSSLAVYGCAVWNVGMITGVFSLLTGMTNGRPLLEFPSYTAFLLFFGFAMAGLYMLAIVRNRRSGPLYISEWYLVGALLWFAWMYAVANVTLSAPSVPGPAQPAINFWYVGCIVDLWMTPVALATAFYLIPKIVEKPIYSEKLAFLGFGGLAIFGGWTGLTHIIGGPLPAWMITAAIVAKVLMLIPVLAVAANFHLTMKGVFEDLRDDAVLRFITTGAMIYTAYAVEASIISLRSIAQFTQFTFVTQVHTQLGLIGFFSMVLFGAIYYVVPRLLGRDWLFPKLATTHFWLNIVGLGLLFFALTIGGLIQGFGLEDPNVPIVAISDLLQPFLTVQNVGVLLILVGNLGFAIAFALILLVSTPIREQQTPVGEPEEAPEKSAAEVRLA